MAKNLHAKIPVDDTLYVHDIVPEAVTRFQQEIQALGQSSARVEITSRVRDISENAVGLWCFILRALVYAHHLFIQVLLSKCTLLTNNLPEHHHHCTPGTLACQERLLPTSPARKLYSDTRRGEAIY